MPRINLFLAIGIVLAAPAVSLAAHTVAQVAAAKSFTAGGIGFKDKQARARKTFTDKFPDALKGQTGKIDDRGDKQYEADLDKNRRLQVRYYNGVLYQIVLVHPRVRSSYGELIKNYGQPDVTAPSSQGYQWRLDNIQVSLKYAAKKEYVTYFDTKYRETAAQTASSPGK